ncbi:MAG: response regulator [Nitrospiraceae bacterium]|nr:MAG: response regulator [Nitrospiraceae bacterium]
MPTILVVDDSLSVRKAAEKMLLEAGLDVALAANGEDAMVWMSSNQPDLVIADVIMPDKSGFEVCTFIRAQANLVNTPVLLISGFVDDEVTRQAEACRADGVIKKPFQGASLRKRVVELLSARKGQEALAPGAAPEPKSTLPSMPPRPAPAAVAAPVAQLEKIRVLRATTQGLEARVAEQEKGLAQAVAQVQDMHTRLAKEEKQSIELRTRLADLEPAVASAKQLLQVLAEFARHSLKP